MARTKTKSIGAAMFAVVAKAAVAAVMMLAMSAIADENDGADFEGGEIVRDTSRAVRRVVGLTIPIAFPEGNEYGANGQPTGRRQEAVHFPFSHQMLYDFLNRVGGAVNPQTGADNPAGSIRDYFLDASNGMLDFYNIVTPIIYLDSAASFYYQGPIAGNKARTSQTFPHVLRKVKELVESGQLDISSVTTNPPDRNGRHEVIALSFVLAARFGGQEGWSASITDITIDVPMGSGNPAKTITFRRRQFSSFPDPYPKLGVFAHEIGHLLMRWGHVYASGHCLMTGGGETNPLLPNPYYRHMAGWIDVIDINNFNDTTLALSTNDRSRQIYRYVRNDREWFYIEARRRVGRNAARGEGLYIWHVNKNGGHLESDGLPPRINIVRADEPASTTTAWSRPSQTAPFRADGGSRNTAFNSTTTPAARYHDGTLSNINISEISALGDTMTFRVGRRAGEPLVYPLTVEHGGGSGYYAPNTTVGVTAPTTNAAGLHFFRWTSDDFDIDNIYSRETFVTTKNRHAMITANFARAHALPGRIEADTAAFWAGFSRTSHSTVVNAGATGGRAAFVTTRDTAQHALYVVDIAQDGEYQLSYRIFAQHNTRGALHLTDAASGATLDVIEIPTARPSVMQIITGGTVSLRRGTATWRLEARPNTRLDIDWIGVERVGNMTAPPPTAATTTVATPSSPIQPTTTARLTPTTPPQVDNVPGTWANARNTERFIFNADGSGVWHYDNREYNFVYTATSTNIVLTMQSPQGGGVTTRTFSRGGRDQFMDEHREAFRRQRR